jgi:hypothetical protein
VLLTASPAKVRTELHVQLIFLLQLLLRPSLRSSISGAAVAQQPSRGAAELVSSKRIHYLHHLLQGTAAAAAAATHQAAGTASCAA